MPKIVSILRNKESLAFLFGHFALVWAKIEFPGEKLNPDDSKNEHEKWIDGQNGRHVDEGGYKPIEYSL